MKREITTILKCPVSGKDLVAASKAALEGIKKHVDNNALKHITGEKVKHSIENALITVDNKFLYLILDGIILLRKDLAIVIDDTYFLKHGILQLRDEKRHVQDFYNETGWHKSEKGDFEDAELFEDLRPVAEEYINNCHKRVSRHLKPKGDFILDAGSGPIQFDAYLEYSKDYKYRICVDLTLQALRQAKQKLGDKGIYLIADITNLPIKSDVVDAAVSLNVIYHIPKDEQRKAIEEITRTLKPEHKAVIVYSWGDKFSLFMNVALFYIKIFQGFQKVYRILKSKLLPNQGNPGLYFHAWPPSYFKQSKWEATIDILVWRSISVPFSKIYAQPFLGGKSLLKMIYNWEERNPKTAGKFGQYPMLVVSKK